MKLLLWDFDGTLGYREGGWTGAILSVLEDHLGPNSLSVEDIRPHLQKGYPWHTPMTPHPESCAPDTWWEALHPVFVEAFRGVGCSEKDAILLSKRVRGDFLNVAAWRLYEDVTPTLTSLSEEGWTHFVLSNHVPELEQITEHLGLNSLVSRVFTSGKTGYEKPHPRSYQSAVEAAGDCTSVWMIGDSYSADYDGARQFGIPSILVRSQDQRAEARAASLNDISQFLKTG